MEFRVSLGRIGVNCVRNASKGILSLSPDCKLCLCRKVQEQEMLSLKGQQSLPIRAQDLLFL